MAQENTSTRYRNLQLINSIIRKELYQLATGESRQEEILNNMSLSRLLTIIQTQKLYTTR